LPAFPEKKSAIPGRYRTGLPRAARRACSATKLGQPQRPDEAEKVAATRAVIEHLHLGLTRAISWFYEQVEEDIIYVTQPASYRRGFRITLG
jgi:hypothetical protein